MFKSLGTVVIRQQLNITDGIINKINEKYYSTANCFRGHAYKSHAFYVYKWLCDCVKKFMLLSRENYSF